MSMSLEYKFTFINVLEEVDEERSLATFRRSSSLPPRPKPEMCSEILSTEEQDGRYVQTLTEKLPGIFGAKAATEDLTSSSSSRQAPVAAQLAACEAKTRAALAQIGCLVRRRHAFEACCLTCSLPG